MVGTLFHASTFEWSAGASALQTLFDAGKLFAESDLAKAQQLSLVATYRQTVITAFSNVENALNQCQNFAIEQAALEREVKASAEAERISELQYREGIVDLTTLIQTQQTLFTAQDALAQARLAHAQAVVGLYESARRRLVAEPAGQHAAPARHDGSGRQRACARSQPAGFDLEVDHRYFLIR